MNPELMAELVATHIQELWRSAGRTGGCHRGGGGARARVARGLARLAVALDPEVGPGCWGSVVQGEP